MRILYLWGVRIWILNSGSPTTSSDVPFKSSRANDGVGGHLRLFICWQEVLR